MIKKNRIPNQTELTLLMDKLEKDEDIKIVTKSLINKIYKGDYNEIDHDFVEEETIRFIKEDQMYEALLSSQIDIESGNFGAVYDKIAKATTINFDKDLGLSIRDIDAGLEEINSLNSDEVIPSGFPSLDTDSVLDGGFRNQEIYFFAAVPGIGKTALLGALAINAFLQGKKVVVYTFETATRRLLTRYYSNLIEKTKKEIINDNDSVREDLESVLALTEGDIIFKSYPANTTSNNDLKAHLNDLWMYKKMEAGFNCSGLPSSTVS